MTPVLVIFLVLAVIGGIVYLQYVAREKRRAALAAWALAHGMTPVPGDGGLDQVDVPLFGKGDGRGWENIFAGTSEERPVRIGDYWYYDESRDSNGRRTKSYSRFSVCVLDLGLWMPRVEVGAENMFTRLADHVGLRDIEFESEEFNRRFNVKSADREFAFKLLDARMLTWLLETAGGHHYEAAGPHLVTYTRRLAPDELSDLLFASNGFVSKIPRLVWADHGKAG
jgi:hypothetical protein